MNVIERGEPVVAASWNDGKLPAPEYGLHRWGRRESTGLGVTLCGIRQEDRGNAWVTLAQLRRLARLVDSPMSTMCPTCEELW